jgi:hypothetical protein
MVRGEGGRGRVAGLGLGGAGPTFRSFDAHVKLREVRVKLA